MNRHHINRTLVILALSFVCSTNLLADTRADFDQAYAAYNEHIQANETILALSAAKDSLKYGSKVFGRNSVNTA